MEEMNINLEENKSYLIKVEPSNKLELSAEGLIEITLEKLSDTGKYAKINFLYTYKKPETKWVLVYHLKPLIIDVINYPIGG